MNSRDVIVALTHGLNKDYLIDGHELSIKTETTNFKKFSQCLIDKQVIFTTISNENHDVEIAYTVVPDLNLSAQLKKIITAVLNHHFEQFNARARAEIRNFNIYVFGEDVCYGKVNPVVVRASINHTDSTNFSKALTS